MKSVSYMADFPAVRMLWVAEQFERRFEECLLACPRTEDMLIDIENPEVFTRLAEARFGSIVMALSAFESYLAYYADQAAVKIEAESPGVTLTEYLDRHKLRGEIDRLPNRLKRRFELYLEEVGNKPVRRFLHLASLSLEEKFLYWPLIRAKKPISLKDGYVKKFIRLMGIKEDLVNLDTELAPEIFKAATAREVNLVFLHHELPEKLTPGKSASDEYVVEPYAEGHLMWELLHCYPAREVQETIQYLHRHDDSDNHFITAIRPAELVDENNKPLIDPCKKYVMDIDLGEPRE